MTKKELVKLAINFAMSPLCDSLLDGPCGCDCCSLIDNPLSLGDDPHCREYILQDFIDCHPDLFEEV